MKKCKSSQNSANKKSSDVELDDAEDMEDEDKEQLQIAEENEEVATTSGPKTVSDIYKERLTSFRKHIMKGMMFSDQLDIRNP